MKKEIKLRFRRELYFAITLVSLVAVSSAVAYLNIQRLELNKDSIIRNQVTSGSLQMTVEAKSTVVVGEATKINITIKNIGNENFTYGAAYPLAPDNKLNIERVGGMERYCALHYRWIDLFNGIGCAAVTVGRRIEPMEERTEVYYAKFLEVGEYNITASFLLNLSCSIFIDVTKTDDIEISLDQAINISSIEDLEFASLIRSESLNHPIWYLSANGYPYHQVIVDAVYGNSTKVPYSLRLSWCILEMLEYQSLDKYMHVIIGATREFTTAMVEQLEELGCKNVHVEEYLVLTRDTATALIPCNYDKVMKIAQLWFVDNLEGLTSIS